MPIDLTQPIEVPAQAFDKVWIRSFTVESGVLQSAEVFASFQAYAIKDSGPATCDQLLTFRIADLDAAAGQDPELAALVTAVTTKLVTLAKAQGLFA